MNNFTDFYEEIPTPSPSLVSKCCGANALGGICDDCYGHYTGICSECGNQADFIQEAEDREDYL